MKECLGSLKECGGLSWGVGECWEVWGSVEESGGVWGTGGIVWGSVGVV